MHRSAKLLMATLVSLIALLALGATAKASNSIEVGGARSVSASGQLVFGNEPRLELGQITCDVTLLRTVGAAIAKTEGTLFGKVTGIAIDRGGASYEHCRLNRFRRLESILPLAEAGRPGRHSEPAVGVLLYDVSGGRPELWKLIYDSFQGNLPNIEGVNFHIQGTQFLLEFDPEIGENLRCLFSGQAFGLIRVVAGTASTATVVLERTRLSGRALSPTLFCPRGTFSGTFTITPNIRIRLV